ncbi:hypothetical protein [Spiroplasma endosymbiont of Diplazon laetatorius]|uniref:hypothetical protein n=1 Tax=Spiroplasma endosymbiont of Diplazon laetatorius TaxID=3066322 RepID=UPI0030CBEE69
MPLPKQNNQASGDVCCPGGAHNCYTCRVCSGSFHGCQSCLKCIGCQVCLSKQCPCCDKGSARQQENKAKYKK